MCCFCIWFPLLLIYVLCFSLQNVQILKYIFPIWPKLATLRRCALIFDHNYLFKICIKYANCIVVKLERAVHDAVSREINLRNIMGYTLTSSQTPLGPSLYTMYLSVLISQTDPAHQLCGVFHVITMLRQPSSQIFFSSPGSQLLLEKSS